MTQPDRCDLAILGGGLAGGLIALAVNGRRPDLKLMLIEETSSIGGNHIWSFFERDIAPKDRGLLAPLIGHSWASYDVSFPRSSRTIASAYHSIRSERLEAAILNALPEESIATNLRVHSAGPDSVLLADGRKISARGVIDARGPANLEYLTLGWQKFVGHEVRLAKPHGLDRPMIMDASLEQIDGFRFVYVLPFSEDRLLIEDTYYSDRPQLNPGVIAPRIAHYAAGHGWRITDVIGEEIGVLPIALDGNFEGYWRSGGDGVAKAGMRAALFHPVTGYSLPDAVRTASLVAAMDEIDGTALHDALHDHAQACWKQRGFYRLLSRMLFRAAMPPERWKVLEQFYRKDRDLISRFYSTRSTFADKARILSGKPPVPLGRAMSAALRL